MAHTKLFATIVLIGIVKFSLAQKFNISFSPNVVKVTEVTNPMFQAVNGNLNIAVNLGNGNGFQLAEIPLKLVNCNAKLEANQYKAILINNLENITYVSTNKKTCKPNKLTITCLNDGILEINFIGKIYHNNKKVKVNATISGAVPNSEYITPTIHE